MCPCVRSHRTLQGLTVLERDSRVITEPIALFARFMLDRAGAGLIRVGFSHWSQQRGLDTRAVVRERPRYCR